MVEFGVSLIDSKTDLITRTVVEDADRESLEKCQMLQRGLLHGNPIKVCMRGVSILSIRRRVEISRWLIALKTDVATTETVRFSI